MLPSVSVQATFTWCKAESTWCNGAIDLVQTVASPAGASWLDQVQVAFTGWNAALHRVEGTLAPARTHACTRIEGAARI